ncbi:MAG: hypothetical protein KGM24_03260 [Elusimicrobia bacterium]|nr:hypothetical protein [Elusimicrobiota bacterium]
MRPAWRLDERRARRLAGWALALGLLVRFAFSWHAFRSHAIATSNDQYETIALSLVHGQGYSLAPGVPTSKREPVFVLFIAAIYWLFGVHPWIVVFLQSPLSVLTGWILWKTARRLFDETTSLAVLVVFLFYPQFVYYCGYFFRETVLCLSFAVLLWASVDWPAALGDRRGDRGAWVGGLGATLFGLCNPATLPACALSGLLIWAVAPAGARLRRFALYTAPLVLFFGIWTARNWAVQGTFVPGETHGGEEFYRALIIPPGDQTDPALANKILESDSIFSQAGGMPEAARSTFLTRASFRWIAEHPRVYAGRVVEGVFKYWRLWPYRMPDYQFPYALLVALSLLSDGWIVPLGFLGLWLYRSRWRELAPFPASLFAMTAVYGAIHAVIRYRLPLMLGMILLSVATVSRLLGLEPARKG